MKPTLLAGAFGFLILGAAPAAVMAQATQPLQQPNSEAAATVPAGELALYIWAMVHGVAMLALDGLLAPPTTPDSLARLAIARMHEGIDR